MKTELFDAVRHEEAYSDFSQFWKGAENIPDKTNVKPTPYILRNSMELVRFYNRIYELPLQWAYNINSIEQS